MRKRGCSLVEPEPEKRAWPFHLHYGQVELFVILASVGTLTGEGMAQQIVNASKHQLRYLALGVVGYCCTGDIRNIETSQGSQTSLRRHN